MMNATRKRVFVKSFLMIAGLSNERIRLSRRIGLSAEADSKFAASKLLVGLPIAAWDRETHQALIKELRAIELRVRALDRRTDKQVRALRNRTKVVADAVARLSVDETRPPTGVTRRILG